MSCLTVVRQRLITAAEIEQEVRGIRERVFGVRFDAPFADEVLPALVAHYLAKRTVPCVGSVTTSLVDTTDLAHSPGVVRDRVVELLVEQGTSEVAEIAGRVTAGLLSASTPHGGRILHSHPSSRSIAELLDASSEPMQKLQIARPRDVR